MQFRPVIRNQIFVAELEVLEIILYMFLFLSKKGNSKLMLKLSHFISCIKHPNNAPLPSPHTKFDWILCVSIVCTYVHL